MHPGSRSGSMTEVVVEQRPQTAERQPPAAVAPTEETSVAAGRLVVRLAPEPRQEQTEEQNDDKENTSKNKHSSRKKKKKVHYRRLICCPHLWYFSTASFHSGDRTEPLLLPLFFLPKVIYVAALCFCVCSCA